jgi:ribosomal protein S18 acetylase RimI-like enzyme
LRTVIRTATAADTPDITASLARAFHDDPVASYALPSDRRRPAQLRRFYTQRLRTLLPDELVFCDPDGRAAALWAAPDRWRTPLPELLRTRIFSWRTPLFLAGGMRVEHRHPTDPHYYLAILGVDPSAQGQGLGSRVLQPMLDRCDAEGVPAYLESSRQSNVGFYERHGFRVTGEVKLTLGPPLWLMWRVPR